MKTSGILLNLVYALLPLLFLVQSSRAAPLPLADALEEAWAAHPRMRQAEAEVESAQAGVTEARSGLLPTLDLSAGYTHTDGGQTMIIPEFDPETGAVTLVEQPLEPEEQWSASATLAAPLYDGGRSWALLRLARQELALAQAALEQIRRETELEVVEAWHGLQLARSRQGIAQAGLDSAQEHLRRTDAMVEQGLVHRATLLRARTRVAALEQALAAAGGGLGLARNGLLKALGRDLGGDVDVPDPAATTGDSGLPEPPLLEEALRTALEEAPEIRQADLGRQMARAGQGIARAAFLPRLDGFANTGYAATDWEDLTDSEVTRVGLSLSLSVLAGWGDRARLHQARLEEEIAAVGIEDLRRGIELAVRASHLDMVVASRQHEAAELGLASALEAHRMTEERFAAGLSPGSEVLDSQTELIQAESDLVQAIHDLSVARARIARYTGA